MTTVPRPPSIKRVRVPVNAESGKVAPVGQVELDQIEPREHAAWMQRVADLIASGASGLNAVEVRVTSLDGSVSTLNARMGAVEQAIADSGSAVAVGVELDAHKADKNNPHATTATQVGADPQGSAAAAQTAAANALTAHEADTSTHGVGLLVGADEAQTLANKRLDATNKYGGTTDYSSFEADGTLVNNGAATTFDDSQAAVIYMRTGGTALTLDVLSGGVYAYRFDSTDEVHSQIQTTHRYKLGTPIGMHIHLINKNAIGATNYNVGIELEWCWAGLGQVMPAATTEATVNCSFQNASALTHKVFELKEITPTAAQNSISSILFFRVKRVTATTQNYATNDIFIAGIDFHNEMDTQGSRQEYVK